MMANISFQIEKGTEKKERGGGYVARGWEIEKERGRGGKEGE